MYKNRKYNKNKNKQKKKHNPDTRLFEKGVGVSTLNMFKKEVGLNKNFPVSKISKIKYTKINFSLFKTKDFFLNRKYLIKQTNFKLKVKEKFEEKKDPESTIKKHIDFLTKKMGACTYRGFRHKKNRSVRGQRTKTNAKTMKQYTSRIGSIVRRFYSLKKFKKKQWKLKTKKISKKK